nr:pyridoxal-phosphate dependent enzyme [Oceanococcus sp. HetDA_MAG_MS8]
MSLPIYQRLPGIEAVLPSLGLAQLPTPVQNWEVDGQALLIKRDDLSNPLYGGNKVRKLDLILAAAQARGTRRIVTFGGLGTHHGLATALFCAKMGLDCEVLLFDQPITPAVQEGLRLLAGSGATLRHTGSVARTLATFYLHPRYRVPGVERLFAGGSNHLGVLAFVNAALELQDQIAAGDCPRPAAVYCPVGSQSTFAGLCLGMALTENPIPVVGVRVADAKLGPFAACDESTVTALMRRTLRWLKGQGVNWPAGLPQLVMEHQWIGGGYGHPTEAAQQASAAFAQAGAPELDPTYTAKTAAAVLSASRRAAGPPVLYWHTLNSAVLSVPDDDQVTCALPDSCRPFLGAV